jgi:hypothetical protein
MNPLPHGILSLSDKLIHVPLTHSSVCLTWQWIFTVTTLRSVLVWQMIKHSSRGKAIVHPITGHEGPEGEQMYSSTISLTSVLDGGGWSTPCPGRFTPRKDPVPIV